MRVLISHEARLLRTKEGAIHTRGGPMNIKKYLKVFDKVVVFTRVEDVADKNLKIFRLDGPNIEVVALPYYVGPRQFFRKLRKTNILARQLLNQNFDAYILRVPGMVGNILWRQLVKAKIPYGVEVVGDPWDALAPGTVKTTFRPILRCGMTRILKRQCRLAGAACYVTNNFLQKRYPPGGWALACSDIDLPDDNIIEQSVFEKKIKIMKSKVESNGPWRLLFIGTLAQLYKSPHILINAVADCLKRIRNLELVLIGDGQYRTRMEKQVNDLGLTQKIKFKGTVSREVVLRELEKADMYILPSLTEGLPRTLIEAMAKGLPCIGSNVGGISELLDAEDLVIPGNQESLAKKILETISDSSRLGRMGRRNLLKSKEYSSSKLESRRNTFYSKLVEITKYKATS